MTTFVTKHTREQIEAFLAHPHLARLATAVPAPGDKGHFQPHNVPVWFLWDGEAVYISAFESTRKLKEARRNPYIAVLIDLPEAVEGVTAVLMEGKCQLVRDPGEVQARSRAIYTRYMGEQGVLEEAPQSWIVDPENTIIRLVPAKIYTW